MTTSNGPDTVLATVTSRLRWAGFGRRLSALVLWTSVAAAAVVGSALVDIIAANLDPDGRPKEGVVEKLLGLVAELAAGIGGADKKVT